jgi:toxin HigB-1
MHVIKSFQGLDTERLFHDQNVPRLANLRQSARRKLLMLNAAKKLADLTVPPGNRLHALDRDRAGQHSIRINDQFRICFVWHEGDAYGVEIVDYH